jgi:hypothetical protein
MKRLLWLLRRCREVIETNDPGQRELLAALDDELGPVDIPATEAWSEDGPFLIHVVIEDVQEQTIADYVMNHNNAHERRVLGEQCRYAYLADQSVYTFPEK